MAFPPMRLLEFHSSFVARILRYQMQLIAQPVTFSVFTLRAFRACLGEPSPCLIRFARSHLLRPKSEGSCRAIWVAPSVRFRLSTLGGGCGFQVPYLAPLYLGCGRLRPWRWILSVFISFSKNYFNQSSPRSPCISARL